MDHYLVDGESLSVNNSTYEGRSENHNNPPRSNCNSDHRNYFCTGTGPLPLRSDIHLFR